MFALIAVALADPLPSPAPSPDPSHLVYSAAPIVTRLAPLTTTIHTSHVAAFQPATYTVPIAQHYTVPYAVSSHPHLCRTARSFQLHKSHFLSVSGPVPCAVQIRLSLDCRRLSHIAVHFEYLLVCCCCLLNTLWLKFE